MSTGEFRDHEAEDGADEESTTERLVGTGVDRREDERLLTGRAEFTDDSDRPGTVHLAFVRSEQAHADLVDIDTADALALDGVRAAYTWADIEHSDAPGVIPIASEGLDVDVPGHPILARDRVR